MATVPLMTLALLDKVNKAFPNGVVDTLFVDVDGMYVCRLTYSSPSTARVSIQFKIEESTFEIDLHHAIQELRSRNGYEIQKL